MTFNPMLKGEEYYQLVGKKDIEGAKKFLHPHVEFISPFGKIKSKEAVTEAIQNFMATFNSLKIKNKFGVKDQAMIVYHTDIPQVAKDFPAASLLTFAEGLIIKIQLFFDGSPFL